MAEYTLRGIAAAEGIAIGPAFLYHPVQLELPQRPPDEPALEMARFQAACTQAQAELARLKESLLARTDAETAAIFDAHALILADPALHQAVKERVEAGQTVEAALVEATEEIAAVFRGMEDEMFAARAADVFDLGRRVLRILLGVEDSALDRLVEPAIVVAHDLTPSDTAGLQPQLTLGFCTAVGGVTSHTAILARTLGLPAVVGLGQEALARIEDGAPLILDGASGQVIVNPTAATMARSRAARERRQER